MKNRRFKLIYIPLTILFCLAHNVYSQGIKITLEPSIDTFNVLDPIVINISLVNESDSSILINYPSVKSGSLSLNLECNGRVLKMIDWLGPKISQGLALEKNQSFDTTFDLTKYYFFLEEGNYKIVGKYYPFLNNNSTGFDELEAIELIDFSFIIRTLSETENRVQSKFLSLQKECGKIPDCVIKMGHEIIEESPKSIFTNTVKFQIGEAYRIAKKYDDCINWLEELLLEKSLGMSLNNETLWEIAWAWYRKGEIGKAIFCLNRITLTPSIAGRVKDTTHRWQTELDTSSRE